jgi:lipopolysaccharide assembly LptE-like protein
LNRQAGALLLALLPAGCGYHVSGHADLLPKNLHSIAIPAFANLTVRYKLSDRLPAALTREFISRTRYRIVADPNEADAVLNGAVVAFRSYPTVLDPATDRASGAQLAVTLNVTLRERASGAVLFNRPSMEVRERYEISVDQRAYFEESDVALDRLSRQVAKELVSAILEAF